VHQSTLIRKRTVRPNQDIGSHGLSEYFDFEGIGNDFFCFTVDIRVNERDVVVAFFGNTFVRTVTWSRGGKRLTCNDVAESTQPFLDTLDCDFLWQGISQMLQFLVRRR
jgi:hypothetical protein